ncbi:cytochrome c oxidase accessory protein CcoG [Azospira inquinata]|uniref:Cytochrome c oxidase accessory protein CcoG n=1 Tax=Azospira inquinata TaxID=2785627 RepID=A0A975XVT2_9RHOO|nr:cytochrome c oxidase accessory protein CcoG [Azospira inquinata]QWT47196.1 cytochrome c oxidase accessory protein CcoG [Azospira inquinata]QWT50176.1 cytochrome c oxidase accessory protein CcoG [Azospira inquinata]
MSETNPSPATPNSGGSLYEKHRKIYAKAVSGLFANWRWVMVFITQAIFYGGPWLQWNGRQAILLHLVERKFYLFGLIFWPQDVIYLAILLMVSAYGLFLVTAVAGRLFCGYACPQTVYTEIFMWIERMVEGDRNARMKLDKAPMSGAKVGKKLTKHALWIILALYTSFTFVGYFTPMNELLGELKTLHLGPWETFWIFFYAGFAYLMAGFMREQVCKYMCPYARFQSVMFDPDTLIITYDPERGDPRGARKKGEDYKAAGKGDCIDCGVCVQVCPTGIDIRNGLQYECIGCAACIDACDGVMDKMEYPRGLIRYSTENVMNKKVERTGIIGHVIRPRILIYSGILTIITVTAGWFLFHRIPLKVDVIRDRATLARETDDGLIENVYTLRVMNTDEKEHHYSVKIDGLDTASVSTKEVVVPSATTTEVTAEVHASPDAGKKGSNPIHFVIQAEDNPNIQVKEKAAFMQPQ